MKPISEKIEMTEEERHDFYVSANAKANGDGTQLKPFSTIEEAQMAVREINSDMTEDINIHILSGTYCLGEPLVLTDADGGTNG